MPEELFQCRMFHMSPIKDVMNPLEIILNSSNIAKNLIQRILYFLRYLIL